MRDFQELADEAFADLLQKHGRPVDLKTALRQSVGEIEKRPVAPSVRRRDAARKAHKGRARSAGMSGIVETLTEILIPP
jgi:hypothetical protein